MMKYVVLLALSLFTSLSGWAFSLDNADIRLLCPQRGQIEVILHIYHQTTGEFAYWYAETEKLVRCRLLSLTTTYPVDIPYYRE